MILIVFIMPPNARIVYYFVMHCTEKLSLLFSAIQNQNIYLLMHIN